MNDYEEIEQTKEIYRNKLPKPEPDWPLKVQRAVKCIHQNLFKQTLTVGWVEQQCRINGHNFSARFAYYLDRTPKKYILYNRTVVAKKILSIDYFSHIAVSQVAFTLGFPTVSTFSKCFKRRTGMSPSRWRNKNGNG